VIVGAPDYSETAETNFAGCGLPDPQVCSGMGRIYVYSGAGITGSLTAPLDSPLITIKYFDTDTAAEQPRFGAAIAPIGDVGGCDVPSGFPALSARCLPGGSPAPSTTQDGFPDF